MSEKVFTAEIDEYIVLTLQLEAYKKSSRELPVGYTLLPEGSDVTPFREREQRLLRHYFVAWRKPVKGTLAGFNRNSPIFVVHGSQLIAGVYLCNKNEFGWNGWGQLHYAFIDPAHGGKGIYSVIFREAVERAQRWKLIGLVLNSDRHLLPDIYERWGAIRYRVIRKSRLRTIAGVLWNLIHGNRR